MTRRLQVRLATLLAFFVALKARVLRRENLSDLVNDDKVRSSIRRLFRNSLSDVLGEIFQNAQRAGAKRVEIITHEKGFIIRDDGHGLLDGVSGFYKLLRIAESSYDNQTIEAQDPMGLGLHSLLALEKVTRVRFASGKLSLSLDTKRWWSDKKYYENWARNLQKLKRAVEGFEITVECDEKLAGSVSQILDATEYKWGYKATPAQGYAGLLVITLNGKPVETGLPEWSKLKPIIETDFEGERLIIGTGKRSTVNFYGQLILCDFGSSFEFHLDVRRGHRPVNPRSPTREGIIQDEAYARLIQFIKDTLFKFLFAPENRSKIRASWVSAFYGLDPDRAKRDAPYFVAVPLKEDDESPASSENINQTGTERIFAYDDEVQPLLIDDVVSLLKVGEEQPEELDYGVGSFVKILAQPYLLQHGNTKRLKVGRVWWRPGACLKEFFYAAGEYGVSFKRDEQPQEWKSVKSDATLYAFSYTSSYDVGDVDFCATAPNPVDFLLNEAWAGFHWSDEGDSEVEQEDYQRSCEAMIRDFVGACVPFDFTRHHILRFFGDTTARIARIEYLYDDEKAVLPKSIVAHSSTGEEVSLKLM